MRIDLRYVVLTTVLLLTGAVPSARAAEPGTNLVQVRVDQKPDKGTVSIRQSSRPDAERFVGTLKGKPKPVVRLHPDDSAQLVIVRALPILFNYSFEVIRTTPTENYTVATEFLGNISPLQKVAAEKAIARMAAVPRAAAAECVVRYAAVCLDVLPAHANTLATFEETAKQALSAAVRNDLDEVKRLKVRLAEIAAEGEKLRVAVNTIADADLEAARLGSQATAGDWEILGAPGRGTLNGLMAAIPAANTVAAALVELADRLIIGSARIAGAVTTAREFEAAFRTALDDKDVEHEPLNYDQANNRVATLVISANQKFSQLFLPDVSKYQGERVGSVEISFETHERLALSYSAGVVYSFVRNPMFTAEPAGTTGQFTVRKKEDDYAELDGVIGMNVTGWRWKPFGAHPFVQLGLVPSSDKLAILLGVGLQLFDRGALSLGAIYQRVERLEAGLAEGSTIATADDLKTGKEFKPGLYLSIAIATK